MPLAIVWPVLIIALSPEKSLFRQKRRCKKQLLSQAVIGGAAGGFTVVVLLKCGILKDCLWFSSLQVCDQSGTKGLFESLFGWLLRGVWNVRKGPRSCHLPSVR